MATELLEIGLAPECVHTDTRERLYYLMKRFVKTAINASKNNNKLPVKIVAFLYETPFTHFVMVDGDANFDDVANIFCTPEFSNDERREILTNLKILNVEAIECECMARGYDMPAFPVFASIVY